MDKQSSSGYGYGKTILFGEHFVVHGIPAIASALGLKTTVSITRDNSVNDIKFIDSSRASYGTRTVSFKENKEDMLCKLTGLLLEKLEINTEEMSVIVKLESTVPEFGGAGLSAALSVSLTKSFSNLYNMNLSNEKIASVAYEGEKMFHGTPSGIDNTVATYGGLLWFVRNLEGGSNIIEPLNTLSKGLLVIGDTRIQHDVKELVSEVRRRKESEPEIYNPIFDQAKDIVINARRLLEEDLWATKNFGKLMNKNHKLLQQVGVSIPELDDLVDIAMKQGALGAKLTGGGGGGCMIALAPNEKTQKKILQTMIDSGFNGYTTTIGN